MKISVNWLKNYVNIPNNTNFHDFGNLFTIRTAEVEEVINLAESFDKMVIGKIESISAHPDADKLRVTQTNIGTETLQIVCGANNIFEGQTVAVALIGAKVHWHGEGDLIELKPVKIRGVESQGMICAASEIGLKDAVDGIMDLSYLNLKPGTPLSEALNKNDIIIDIENKTLTHRPDLWGHYGIAREVAAILGEKLKPIEFHQKYDQKLPKLVNVEIHDQEMCPRYLTVTLDNIKVEPSPDWLRNALENTGNRSINNIVDATNFVMLELGNPLHAFDHKIIKEKLEIRKAKSGETIITLDQEEKKLDSETLIIADAEKPLAIAGVKGGLHSGINEHTTSITLEAANFNPISTRKSSIRHNIRTESVQRFEKDLDPLLAEQALDRLVKIILDLCPQAKIISQKQDINYFSYKPRIIKLNLDKASSKIGIELDGKTVKELLEKLDFEVKVSAKTVEVKVPSFRATKDINHQDDLIEEIARLYGYEKLPVLLPALHMRPAQPNTERQGKYLLRNLLSLEHGFSEALNYSFYSKKTLESCNFPESKHLKVKNYLSEEQTHLRISLIPGLLANTRENLKHCPAFKLYEFGRTYKNINQYFPLEEKQLAGIIVLDKKSKEEVFYQIKTVIENLLNHLGLNSLQYRKAETQNPLAHPNRHAAWYDHKTKQEIIQIYDLHPAISKHFEIDKQKIACFEINYTELHKLPHSEKRYKPIPKFPAIEIDISAIFKAEQEVGQIEKSIKKADQNLISKVKLFDFYQGDNIPSDKKALAYKVTLQASDRTLTDTEMHAIQQKIFSNLESLGGEIRRA
jgi:phenylalanyl-tRNA synthetase beta chain